ncbi:MAG: response regulator transcription factor [Saprospiraceae bacterium]|nr:response regulator transcription factor [Saprospiraceae bacterium]
MTRTKKQRFVEPAHILFVDDERHFSSMTSEYLEALGHQVEMAHSGDAGLAAFKVGKHDLCILDVKMPMKDGFTLAREIRELDPEVPIIFLTGQSEKKDRIKGLSIGGDDYVTKPFSLEELALRISNLLRRMRVQGERRRDAERFQIGRYSFDPHARELRLEGAPRGLTGIEARLLYLFCESADGMVSRDLALKRIWGDEDFLRSRSLNVYVSRLRNYLKGDPDVEILNIHGVGYRMVIRS